METQNESEAAGPKRMLPPSPATFQDREDLIKYVRDFGANQGYVVTIKKSRKDRRVILGCDRGGVYRNRRKIDENKRKRKATSRLINCPFEAIGKKEDDAWVLTIKNGEHNHKPLKDMSEHPYSRRFSEEEVRQIQLMTEAGVKPRQVLKLLKQSNPELQSTPRHLYNLKAKMRQGNISDKTFKSWRPNRSIIVETNIPSGGLNENSQPVKVPNFIGGRYVDSHGSVLVDVTNPATQEIVSQVPLTTYEEFKSAVSAAKQAFPSWKNTPITSRQRIMFKLQELIHRDIDKLSLNITMEQGKTLKGAHGDVLRGLEVVEHACGMANLQMGEFVPNACNGIDTYCIREPLGVCAGICPINFPAMIPLWMFPIAVTCGNTFILKPCEKNPGASMILAALAMEAGLPDGVLNIVHGTHEIVNYMCDDEDIKAISFVGPITAGINIYARAAAKGKRVQSYTGSKNHAIVMPDASMDATLDALVAAGFGAAGGRCMTLSNAIFVGGSMPWEQALVQRAKVLKVNEGTDPEADLGPVISKEAKERICRLVRGSIENGAKLLLDGRHVTVPGYEKGNFIGPTVLTDVTTDMECYKVQEEIFGPVLLCMQADSLDEAISIVNQNKHDNGVSIFTTSAIAARKFQNEVEAGLVGINVPVPIPFSSLNGPKTSFTGDLNARGKAGVQFYTQTKTVAQLWKDLPGLRASPTAYPSETDITNQQASSLVPPTSERDSPGQILTMPLEPESNSPSHDVQLAISDADMPKPTMSSVTPADRNLRNHGMSLLVPSTSERDLADQDMSLVLSPESQRDLQRQVVSTATSQPSERMYVSKTLQWNESSPGTSQRSETISPNSEKTHVSAYQRNSNISTASQRTDTSIASKSQRVYIPMSHKIDAMRQIPHRSDNISSTPHGIDASMASTSGRVYIMESSLMNENIGQTFERSDPMFPTSERIYMPATSHRSDIVLRPASERIYTCAASHGNEDITPASQLGDALPPTSERGFMPSIVQKMHQSSERLYIPANSQRMYSQNPIISMEEFPSQAAAMTLPTSQRL